MEKNRHPYFEHIRREKDTSGRTVYEAVIGLRDGLADADATDREKMVTRLIEDIQRGVKVDELRFRETDSSATKYRVLLDTSNKIASKIISMIVVENEKRAHPEPANTVGVKIINMMVREEIEKARQEYEKNPEQMRDFLNSDIYKVIFQLKRQAENIGFTQGNTIVQMSAILSRAIGGLITLSLSVSEKIKRLISLSLPKELKTHEGVKGQLASHDETQLNHDTHHGSNTSDDGAIHHAQRRFLIGRDKKGKHQ